MKMISALREKTRAIHCRVTPSLPCARGASRYLHFLSCAADVSPSGACLASRLAKRSEQTLYDAATREVLQIDFRTRGKRIWLEECAVGAA
jgi:hypothetical protein